MTEKYFKVKAGVITPNVTFSNRTVNSNLAVTYTDSNVLSIPGSVAVGTITLSNTVIASGTVGTSGQVLTSNGAGVYWSTVSGGSGGGSSTFIGLTDTPTVYTGAANQLLGVNSAESGIGFTNEIQISEFILSAMTAPSNVVSDSISMYVTATGTSPTREVAYKLKNELGQEIIISSILV